MSLGDWALLIVGIPVSAGMFYAAITVKPEQKDTDERN